MSEVGEEWVLDFESILLAVADTVKGARTLDEVAARSVARTSIRVTALLNQLVEDLQARLTENEHGEMKRVIADIIGSVAIDLLNPILTLHSSIDVSSSEAWRKTGDLTASDWLKSAPKA